MFNTMYEKEIKKAANRIKRGHSAAIAIRELINLVGNDLVKKERDGMIERFEKEIGHVTLKLRELYGYKKEK